MLIKIDDYVLNTDKITKFLWIRMENLYKFIFHKMIMNDSISRTVIAKRAS